MVLCLTVLDMELEQLLRPRSIAVVGASPRTFVGQVALNNCRALGFSGSIYPVGRHTEIAGLRAYPSLTDLPEQPDLALVQVRTDRVMGVIEEGLQAGVSGFIVPGSGFTDSGQAALDLVRDLKSLRREQNFELIGPNCMGALDLVSGAAPYIGTVNRSVRRGSVALIAQSGAVVEAVVNSGGRVPLSTAVSAGSEAITDMAAYLNYFAADEHTTAVLAFIEAITDAQRLTAAVELLTACGKPVAVCIVGHSETAQEGVTAHSGKLAAGARLTTAAFKQAGAIIASDLDELLALGELLGVDRPIPQGNKVHVVTNSGGEGNLLADIADAAGLDLPRISDHAKDTLQEKWPTLSVRNPLDPWGTDDYEAIYPAAMKQAASESGDILLVAMDQHRSSGIHELELGRNLAQYLSDATEPTEKFPVLLSPVSDDVDPELVDLCRRLRLPLLRGARNGLSALAKLCKWSDSSVRREQLTIPEPSRAALLTGDSDLSEDHALDIFATLGVRTPRRISVDDPTAAAEAAASFGRPVVLKGIAEGVTHKTERGLVAISPLNVEATAREMSSRNQDLDLSFLVVEQIRGDLEVLVGYKRDDVFGPVIILGTGGIWAEFHADISMHIGFLNEATAADLLDSSTVGRMINSARGGALDRKGVITALLAVSELAQANPDFVSIDINPLIVGRDHSTAVDAVIERRQPAPSTYHSLEGASS